MQLTKRRAVVLVVISLALFVLQAGFWVAATAHVRSQTDEANRIIRHSPTEIPGIAGVSLLILAGLLVIRPGADS
ncbi:MAG TPA: hypothetical protein VE077_16675 [Candidatus Methylomirabilis sp.]|nr:hypothetical protein [Candidatus Methylomirabilis sp.]